MLPLHRKREKINLSATRGDLRKTMGGWLANAPILLKPLYASGEGGSVPVESDRGPTIPE